MLSINLTLCVDSQALESQEQNDHEPKILNITHIIELHNILMRIFLFQVVTKEGLDEIFMMKKIGMVPVSHPRLRKDSQLRLFHQL